MLHIVDRTDIPLPEVSGLASTQKVAGTGRLTAVGDRKSKFAWADLRRDIDDYDWHIVGLPSELQGDAQWEGVALDTTGRVVLLREQPAQIVALAPGTLGVEIIKLEVPRGHALEPSWRDEGSGPESLVLLSDGHVLVAREKEPVVFAEFGPRDRQPVLPEAIGVGLQTAVGWHVPVGDAALWPLAVWWPDEEFADTLHDLSDLAIGPNGELYALSDQSQTIGQVSLDSTASTAFLTRAWRIGGDRIKPEGLAFLPDGRPLVGLDTTEPEHNLVLLNKHLARP